MFIFVVGLSIQANPFPKGWLCKDILANRQKQSIVDRTNVSVCRQGVGTASRNPAADQTPI